MNTLIVRQIAHLDYQTALESEYSGRTMLDERAQIDWHSIDSSSAAMVAYSLGA
jgi:hypothetical protein